MGSFEIADGLSPISKKHSQEVIYEQGLYSGSSPYIAHPTHLQNTERFKLPEIGMNKRTGSYDMNSNSNAKLQARLKQQMITKRKPTIPSVNLPKATNHENSLSMRHDHNLKISSIPQTKRGNN